MSFSDAPKAGADSKGAAATAWQFLTNHIHVLVAIRHDPDIRQREIAELVGITEGAVQRIVHELTDSGYLTNTKVGRRNHYEINDALGLRHPMQSELTLGDLLNLLDRQATSS